MPGVAKGDGGRLAGLSMPFTFQEDLGTHAAQDSHSSTLSPLRGEGIHFSQLNGWFPDLSFLLLSFWKSRTVGQKGT